MEGISFIHEQLRPPKTIEQIIAYEIMERESNADLLESEENWFSQYLDTLNSALRPNLIELFRQEAEVLRALDPLTATLEEIESVRQKFKDQRDSLTPKAAD